MKDASRAVGVCQTLVTARRAPALRRRGQGRACAAPRAAHAASAPKAPQLTLGQARPTSTASTGVPTHPPRPAFLGVQVFDDYPLDGAGALHRLDAVLQRLGIRRQVPRHSHRRGGRRGGEQPVRGCAAHAREAHRRELAQGARRWSGSFPANSVGDDDIAALRGRLAPASVARGCTTCASRRASPTDSRMTAWPISWRRRTRASRTTSARFAVTAGIGIEAARAPFRARAR